MVAFNTSMIDNWKEIGHRYILVMPREKYGVLRPLSEDRPVKKGYVVEIDELHLIYMAGDYFLIKEKDAMQLV